MIAILSDIHANLEALQAVLEDISKFPTVEAIYCLGDLVGYGPDPIPCVQMATQWDVVLVGNHDLAAVDPGNDLDGWGALAARTSVLGARAQLQQHSLGPELSVFLWGLRSEHTSGGNLFVHGSPRHPVHEYVNPEDIYNDKKMNAVMSRFENLCFCGHTHLPGIFRRNYPAPSPAPSKWNWFNNPAPVEPNWDYFTPEDFDFEFSLTGEQLLCNVGSVGQPRDEDPRACYVLFSPDVIEYRRIEYDVERTVAKLRNEPDGDFFGERLRIGR